MIKPLSDRILIEVEKKAEVTSSGIYMPETDDEKLERAIVVEVGDEVTNVKKGDAILFKGYSADTIDLEGEEVCFIKEEDVLATI